MIEVCERNTVEELETEVAALRAALWSILYWDQENVIPDELAKAGSAAIQPVAVTLPKHVYASGDLLGALLALTSNPHLHLGDLVYYVREREGEGWDGPAVKAWSDAVMAAKAAIAKAKGEQQ